jgi:hypothetical protein
MHIHPSIYILAFAAFTLILYVLLQKQKQRKGRKHQSMGVHAEEKAIITLQKQGFKLIDRSPKTSHFILISGAPHPIQATPDLLMKKGNQKWIFEIKSQKSANIHRADVRRQLREYAALFPNYHLAFFDANTHQWMEIIFPKNETKWALLKKTLLVVILILMGMLLQRYIVSNFI